MHGGHEVGYPITVINIINKGIAANAGLQSGDVIKSINGRSTNEMTHTDARYIISSSHSSLSLTVDRTSPASHTEISTPIPKSSPRTATVEPTVNLTSDRTTQSYSKPSTDGSFPPRSQPTSQQAPPKTSADKPVFQSSNKSTVEVTPRDVPTETKLDESPQKKKSTIDYTTSSKDAADYLSQQISSLKLNKDTKSSGPPFCYVCKELIRGAYVTALDYNYCQKHFVCTAPNCGISLVDKDFSINEEKLLCKTHYAQFCAPRCDKCGQPIINESISALGKRWHVHCFCCFHCKRSIEDGRFHFHENRIFCVKDWNELYSKSCSDCKLRIDPGDRYIQVEALNNRTWHTECFKCAVCRKNLAGVNFVSKMGEPQCTYH